MTDGSLSLFVWVYPTLHVATFATKLRMIGLPVDIVLSPDALTLKTRPTGSGDRSFDFRLFSRTP